MVFQFLHFVAGIPKKKYLKENIGANQKDTMIFINSIKTIKGDVIKKLMFVLMVVFPLTVFGGEIDCKKANYIINFKNNSSTVEDTLSEEERKYCDDLREIKREAEERDYAKRKLKKSVRERTRLKLILPTLKKSHEADKDIAKIEAKYEFLDKDFYQVLFGIEHALKEINSTEIVNDITVTLGNFKKGLIKNGYTEEQAMQVITALLGTKAIPVDL